MTSDMDKTGHLIYEVEVLLDEKMLAMKWNTTSQFFFLLFYLKSSKYFESHLFKPCRSEFPWGQSTVCQMIKRKGTLIAGYE